MSSVHLGTNWQVFFCYCVSLGDLKGKEVADLPRASALFLIIRVASAVHDDKEHTGAGVITSPHSPSVYTSVALTIIPPQASLWAEWCFLFRFIFPNTLQYGIQYFFGSSGAVWTNFFQEMCLWRFINSILGLSFYPSVPLLHTPNERDSFSHSGKNKKWRFGARQTLVLIFTQPLTGLMS